MTLWKTRRPIFAGVENSAIVSQQSARLDRLWGLLGMAVSLGKILAGIGVAAVSFWATLAILGPGGPPSGAAPQETRSATTTSVVAPTPVWNEALYLAVNADVASAVASGVFKSGRDHYEAAGRTERRQGGFVPSDWNEAEYLRLNPDVADAISAGRFLSGYHHYLAAGRAQGRRGGFPADRAQN